MTNDNRAEYVTRELLLKLLSDDEVAKVSTAETATALSDGDEYVDLQELGQGVRRANGKPLPAITRVIPRKAVRADTWRKIVTLLDAPRGEAVRSSAR